MAASIVAAIDRSPAALQAARLLADYRGDRAALSVVLVNVQPAGTRDADLRRDGAAELDPARELLAAAGLAVETRVHLGEPSTRVIEEAAQRKAAAIVAGTRGRGVLGGFALGSVSLP
ncbi:MAG TPA: universal stress protein [Burkholderiales bacterium]